MSSVAWQQFLTTQGAHIDAQHYAHFNTTTAENRLFDLSALGLIAVKGEDAQTFLQGQLTNDIKQVDNGAQLTGYCTAKGRLLALFYAWKAADIIYLQCPRNLVPDLVKRLRMFVMRSKVTVDDVSEQWVCLGLSGPELTLLTPEVPAITHALASTPTATYIRLPDSNGLARAQMMIASSEAQGRWQSLAEAYTPSSTSSWDVQEIQAGIPQVYAETKEQFVPQMLNLDALDGINFKKGCYTGQEIVARTHYLGKVKRRTLIAYLPLTNVDAQMGQPLPQVGQPILDTQQQEAGQLVRVAPEADKGWWLLAECRIEAKEAGDIFWQGKTLNFKLLPYLLP